MAKVVFETIIECGETTCNDCQWVYGEKVGQPYCGWFSRHALQSSENADVGSIKADKHTLLRLPECLAAEVQE